MKDILSVRSVIAGAGLWCTLTVPAFPAGAGESTSFGPRVDRTLTFTPGTMFLLRSSSAKQTEIAVSVAGKPEIRIFEYESGGTVKQVRSVHTSSSFGTAMPTPDHRILLFSEKSGKAAVLDEENLVEMPLAGNFPRDADRLAFADINNDGKGDLLFFGKERSGIAVFTGTRAGTFSQGITLFPDFSIGDVESMDLNRDGIADLFVADWLSNQMLLYNGIGGGVFSEQIALSLPGEPGDITLLSDPARKSVRVGIAFPDLNEVRLFNGNSIGDFVPVATLRCPGPPKGLRFADVSGDGKADVVVALGNGIQVFSQTPDGQLADPVFFSIGGEMTDWVLGDVDGNHSPEAIVLCPKSRQLSLLGNVAGKARNGWPPVFAVGLSPEGIATGDFNGDKLTDIAVVNSGSSSFSVLVNEGNGTFGIRSTIRLPEGESTISTLTDAAHFSGTFVASRMSIRWVQRPASVTTVVLPLPDPRVLFAEFLGDGDRLAFLVRSRDGRSGSSTLSLFDQISGDQYIETSLHPTPPARITAITSHDFTGSRLRDLIFSTFDPKKGRSSVFVAEALSRFSFLPPRLVYTLPDSATTIEQLIPALIDADPLTDLLAVQEPTGRGLVILLSDSSGGVKDSAERIPAVRISREDACVLQDLNDDGTTDLCFSDGVSGNVVVYFGKGGGRFGPQQTLFGGDDVNAISVAFLNENRHLDLVLSHGQGGTVSIVFDPFLVR